jgi:hypothetical protein
MAALLKVMMNFAVACGASHRLRAELDFTGQDF